MSAGTVDTRLDVFDCELGGTMLVEASAGTGKTWSLSALYMRLLLEHALPVQEILVVTFTKAATAELRERIRGRIVETLAAVRSGPREGDPFVADLLAAVRGRGVSDDDITSRLEVANATFDEASIFTIHGFCQRALADTPFAGGMPLSLDLLESDVDLRREVVNDFWRRRVAGGDLDGDLAAWLLGGKDTPETLDRLLARRLTKPLSVLRWPEPPALPEAALDLPGLRDVFAAARRDWQQRRPVIEQAVRSGLGQLNARSYHEEALQAAAGEWEQALFHEEALGILQRSRKSVARLELLGQRRLKEGTKQRCTTPSDPFFDLAQRLLDARRNAEAALVDARLDLLRALLDEGPPEVRRRKRERRLVAFDDMLFNLHQRLAGGADGPPVPWLAAALRERFPAALIDEFQDTDPLQFEIFGSLYADSGRPLVFVGDPKQAIYSFRGADLHTYLDARRHAATTRSLADNQRSSRALIDAVNAVFGANGRAFVLEGLGFQPATLGAKPRGTFVDAKGPRGPLQAWMLPVSEGKGLKKEAALEAAATACAAEAARLLHDAAEGQVLLDGRPLGPGDLAVLVRTHRQGNLVRAALRALGIGSAELSQASVYHTSDADEIERVLRAVLEPTREHALRGALATEILGRDAAALEQLADDEAAVAEAMTRFAAYRELWQREGIAPMLRRLMHDEQVAERLLARPDGERRMTNLLHLAERLQEASVQERTPPALLRWLHRVRDDERGEEAAQLRLDSDRNLVQIVTVHKAKGLEYPVVFCPYLWDMAAPPDRGDGTEYHDDEGRAVMDFRPGAKDEEDIKRRRRDERAAEEVRLIYVALTRAVHRCYVVAGCTAKVTESAHGMLNWLVAGEAQTTDDWFKSKPGAEAIGAAWSALAARAPQAIAVEPLPTTPGTPVPMARPAVDTLQALALPRPIPAGWRIGSFSGMLTGAPSRPAADHDVEAAAAAAGDQPDGREDEAAVPLGAGVAPPASTAAIGPDDILAFPRGMDAGTCLHAMFERIDFADETTWLPAVRTALALHPQNLPGPDARARLERMALAMIGDVVRTPLPCGFALQAVPRSRRLEELEFHLPAPRLPAARLARLLQQHGYVLPPLGFGRLDGYLNGFIDLVFEHEGRHYLLDWKSNHLGHTAAAYGPAGMEAAMAQHGYHLQHLLYAVALDRYLALRLPGYERGRHFGGVLYLFVRGVRPGWSAGGQPAGVFFHRPADAVIDELSALLRAPSVAEGEGVRA